MNKCRELSCLKILALILLALILTGCLGGKAQATPTPPATATVSEQGEPVAPNQLPATITPPAEEVASPSPEPVKEATPTETPSPTETAPAPSQTPTLKIAPTDTAAPALGSDFYEPTSRLRALNAALGRCHQDSPGDRVRPNSQQL